ncbi:ATP-binding cassette domain-containing protein [Escherichia coli]
MRRSGSGKSSLLNALSGFLSYQGSLRINGIELRDLSPESWRKHLSWVGQNPQLPAATLRDNVLLARPDASEQELQAALDNAWVSEFLPLLPQGVDTPVRRPGCPPFRGAGAARGGGPCVTKSLFAITVG